uniref:Uncharacterized protein n=1 Tax=Alexandrium andersonii TaxID=327968 RepID=A0A7S2FGN2_9DINO|mmetsp:Transcript_2388/g.5363  ORF Transcript_2388/g.5363 Transcript_2388/m.5363 type:complete len:235 (+) Transcript_2388:66-770(+)
MARFSLLIMASAVLRVEATAPAAVAAPANSTHQPNLPAATAAAMHPNASFSPQSSLLMAATTPANASLSHPSNLRGALPVTAPAGTQSTESTIVSTSGNNSHADRAAQVLAATRAGAAKANATTGSAKAGEAEAEWLDWGRGRAGETCCMCSYQVGGARGTVIIYAAEDYGNRFRGRHGAFWRCERECEMKCEYHTGGHKFGCLDEDHLRSLSRVLRRAPGFEIEHQRRFGNLC